MDLTVIYCERYDSAYIVIINISIKKKKIVAQSSYSKFSPLDGAVRYSVAACLGYPSFCIGYSMLYGSTGISRPFCLGLKW